MALELLVHGVGGATPAKMLDGDPRTQRITGDETAGIYRHTEDADAEHRPQDYRDRPVPEAYCWSGLTSGDGSRALWLLLLPFMIINLAHWNRPAADRREGTVRLYGLLVRLIALTLTVLLVAAVCEVALDLTAWQCAGSTACADGRSWLGFAAPGGGWWSQPGRRIALAALAPLALIGLLWFLSTRTWSAYESAPPIERTLNEDDPAVAHQPALRLPGFWYGRRLVARLRAIHTAAGFLTIAATLTAATARYDRGPGGPAALDAIGWTLLALIQVSGLAVLYAVCHRGRSETAIDHTLDRLAVRKLPGFSLVLLALSALYAGWSRPDWQSQGRLPGDQSFGLIALTQVALILALAVVAGILYRSAARAGHTGGLAPQHAAAGDQPDHRVRTPLAGLAGPAVAVLGCALGGVLTGGVAQRFADWLDGGSTPGMSGGPIAGPPVVLSWQAAVIPPILLLLVLLLLVFVWRIGRVRRALEPTTADGYPGEKPDPVRSKEIANTIARAGVTDSIPWIIGPAALMTLLLGCLAVAGAWATGEVPGRAADGTPAFIDAVAQAAQGLGSWLVGVVFALLLALGRRAYRDSGARRTVGILWDVGTFWPRAAHPFAPPCYAERAVPDLTWRMQTWTENTGGRLVISGHSQGSVLAAAAVWQLDWRTRRRVALLTYGSPVERLYGRWFPAYFGPAQLAALHQEVHCWRNLWRYTDPIGGPIEPPALGDPRAPAGRPPIDRGALKDPLVYGRTADHPLPAPILGHSDYQADPAFAVERAALLARLGDGGVPGQRATQRPTQHAARGDEGGAAVLADVDVDADADVAGDAAAPRVDPAPAG